VIVIGDVVGDGSRLGFRGSIGAQLQIVLLVVAEHKLMDSAFPMPLRGGAARVQKRTIVLDDPFQGLPAQIEPVKRGVASLQNSDGPQTLGVVVEAAILPHCLAEGFFPRMAEGRVAKIMRQRDGLGQIFVQAQGPSQRAGDLRHLQAVCQAGPIVVALVIDEHLGLVGEPAKRRAMNNPVAIPLKRRANDAIRLVGEPSPAFSGKAGIGGGRAGSRRGKVWWTSLVRAIAPPPGQIARRIDKAVRSPHLPITIPKLGNSLTRKKVRRARKRDSMTADSPVTVTASAARRINQIIAGDAKARMLRISVSAGGCSGFQYEYLLVESAEPDDIVIEKDGATLLIDPVSLPLMAGAQVDFVSDLMGAAFKVNNPNATASCGCGTSFAM
jgi:iron-sulfur cluster assembly accessory protein